MNTELCDNKQKVSEMLDFMDNQLLKEGLKSKKVGDVIAWVSASGMVFKNMIIGFSKNKGLAYIHVDKLDFFKCPIDNMVVLKKIGHVPEDKREYYLQNKEYEVISSNLSAFFSKYLKDKGRNHLSLKKLIDSLRENHFCMIPSEVSTTDTTVTFYDELISRKLVDFICRKEHINFNQIVHYANTINSKKELKCL